MQDNKFSAQFPGSQPGQKLGAVDLSPDILAKANIGLWAFELDDGQPPRMYVDDTMLGLIGLDHPVSPEETYHAWYDRIDEAAYDLVNDAVEKMTAGEHAEVQYPWHHPDGHTMVVRCGGVRNPGYTRGIRIEGTHQDVTALLRFDEEEVKRLHSAEVQLQHEQLRAEVLNYMIDHDDDPIELLKNFAERLRVLISCDQVIYRDLEETRIMVNSPAIAETWSVPFEYCQQCQHLDAHHPMYAGGYTEMDNCQEGWQGIPVYEKCPIKSSLTRIVYCDGEVAGYLAIHYVQNYHHFTDVERTTLEEFTRILSISLSRYEAKQRSGELNSVKRMMNMIFSLSDEYDPIIVIDPETGEYDWFMGKAQEVARNTSMNLHGSDFFTNILIDGSTVIHPEDRARFMLFYTRENLARIVETGETLETENRWFLETENQYRWKYNKAVRMTDEDGKVYVVVGVVDTTAAKEKEYEFNAQKEQIEAQQKRIRESLTFTNFFLDTYVSAYYVNLDTLTCQVYKRTEELEQDYPIISDYLESLTEYIRRDVHPEDREALLELVQPERMRALLDAQPEFSHIFRDISGGARKTYRLQVIRGEDRQHAAFGFVDISEELREQNRRILAEEENRKIIEGFANSYDVVYRVNLSDATYSTLKIAGGMAESGRVFPDFLQARAFFLDHVVYPLERASMAQELELETIRKKLQNASTYRLEYRAMINNRLSWNEMVITSLGEDDAAIGMIEKSSELLYRHLNQKINDDIYALFVADLDEEVVKVEKASAWYTTAKVGDILPYSQAMNAFASNLKGCDAADFFRMLSDIDHVREEMRTEDKHTYSYKSSYIDEKWITVTSYVILRHADGSPAIFTLAFSLMDTLGSDRQELQSQLQQALSEATEEKQRNDVLHNIIHSGKWSFLISADDEILSANYSEEVRRIVNNDFSDELHSWIQILHPDDIEETLRAFNATIADHSCSTPYDVSYRMADRNGAYHWFHSAGRILRNEDGTGEFFGIHIDITNQIEEQLEQQSQLEKNLEIIQALASDYSSVYYVDLDTEKVTPYSMNEETRRMLGDVFAYVDHFPQAFRAYVEKFVYEPDREMLLQDGRKENVLSKLADQQSYTITFRGLNEGVVSFCEMKFVAAHRDGDEIKSVALGFAYKDDEIMAQYINEKLVAEYISAFMVDLDHDSYRIYRHPDSTSVMERPDRIWSLAMSDFAEECDPEYVELVRNIGSPEFLKTELADVDRREYQYRFPSASQPWRRAVVQVLDRTEGVPSNIVATFMGIDDYQSQINDQQKQLEIQQKQLQEALSMAQSASRAKTTFLNNMSHDIRTPMNAIIGYTGLAASHIDNKEQVQDYLSKIGQSSDHLLSLINDVLDMSRIESGKMNLEEKEENLSDIIHTLRDIVQADVRSKQLDFFVDAVEVNDEDVICDKLRLNQVLLNVLSNAIKYTPAGGTISMRVSEKTVKDSGYGTYEFRIKDSGMGMDKEFLETIFDPFTRMRSSTVSGIQGTGLGMAISKNIVDMMGGNINIWSIPGKGTEVTITLDFKLQSAPKEPVQIAELAGVRGLVVDDDASTCISIANMLRDIGMRDEWCTSGKEAVIRASEAFRRGERYKVYIIDWLMPDMNGIETARRIRKVIGDDDPIIILTAYDWSDVEDEAREAGVTAFVSKPMFPSDLHRTLNRCLGKADSSAPKDTEDYSFAGKKLLLAEDNELNREIAVELLQEYGFEIDTAEDGDIAVEKVRTAADGAYDLILMDIQMPRMDGYEATRQIRALGTPLSRIPILAMTANAFEEDRRQALEAGMNAHIAKPIDIQKLKETLAEFL